MTRKVTTKEVNPEEIKQVGEALLEALPELRDVPTASKNAGFSSTAQTVIIGRFENLTGDEIAEAWAQRLDLQAWRELKAALKEITEKKIRPHADLIFGYKAGTLNPWCKAAMAVLGSRHVYFTGAGMMGLSLAGLSVIGEMWHIAQETRKLSKAQNKATQKEAGQLEAAMAGFNRSEVIDVVMPQGGLRNVPYVTEIVRGEYVGRMGGDTTEDVTELLRKKYFKDGLLKLEGVELESD